MMMMPDKKKMMSIILGSLSPSNEARKDKMKDSDEPEDDKSSALRDAMEKFLRAVKSESPDGMVRALKDFVYLCEDEKETVEED